MAKNVRATCWKFVNRPKMAGNLFWKRSGLAEIAIAVDISIHDYIMLRIVQ